MGSPNLTPVGHSLDDLRRAVQKLASLRLNADSTPTFASQTITGLTANRLVASNASQVLVSSDLYSWVTETSNQVLIADDGDGTVTFSTPQDIHTGASPTFANLSLGTGELTAGSINRASGTLTLEIGGTAEISITSSAITFGGNLIIPDDGYLGSVSDTDAIQINSTGNVALTQIARGIFPIAGDDLATKEYVDLAIGSSFDLFLSDTDDAVVADTHVMYAMETGDAESTENSPLLSDGPDKLAFSWLSEVGVPETDTLREGVYDCHVHLKKNSGGATTTVYWKLSYVDANGTSNKTLVTTSETTGGITTSEEMYDIHAVVASPVPTGVTKRLLFELYANIGTGQDVTLTITMEGDHDSHVSFQVPSSVWQHHGDVLDDLNTVGQVGADGEFLVGTGAGAFTYESPATVLATLSGQAGAAFDWNSQNLTGIGTITSGNITILDATPILVFKDSNSLGSASIGYIEWRDSGGGRAGFLGNNSSGNDDLYWKNEQGGNIGIETTGAGELQIFADTVVTGTLSSGVITQSGTTLANTYQPLDTGLTSLAGLTYASDSFIKVTATDMYAIRTIAETKSDLSLNLVENTALSTWAGTSSITTLGTISAGTWQGTTVAVNQGGTGKSSWTQYLIPYADTTTSFSQIAIGTDRQVLISSGAGSAPAFEDKGFVDRGDPTDVDFLNAFESGTTTGTGGGNTQLKDSTATFVTKLVSAGHWAHNTTDDTWSQIVSVDSETQITVNDAIFPDIGDTYTVDGHADDVNWHDLDLGPGGFNIVPTGAVAVLLYLTVRHAAANSFIEYQKKGAFSKNKSLIRTQVADVRNDNSLIVVCDADSIIQYRSSTGFTTLSMTVGGWWV